MNSSGDTNAIFCGGLGSGPSNEKLQACYEFGASGFNETAISTLTYGTKYEASVVQTFSTPAVQEQFIWITGGLDKNNEIRKKYTTCVFEWNCF